MLFVRVKLPDYKLQVFHDRWGHHIRINGEPWLNALGHPRCFPTAAAAVRAAMRELCVRVAEVERSVA